MRVIVCGAGQVGSNIARYLAGAGNDVTVIDQRAELAQRISESLDIQGLAGFASHPDILERAGAANADLLIAVTLSDEVNMVACQVAHSLFDVPTKIARIRTQSYLEGRWRDLFARQHLPIDYVISPEREVARDVLRRLQVPGALEVIPFADDRVRLIAVRCEAECPILNTPLRQLDYLFPDLSLTVVGIAREDQFFIPTGDDPLIEGDEVFFVVATGHVGHAMPIFGHEERAAERAVIAGGGNIGLFLATELEEELPGLSLKIIEGDRERAVEIAERLQRTTVLHGDARDREILEEANVHAAEAFVGLTNSDEVNILASLLAKRYGCQSAFALINNNAYAPLTGTLGLDVVINPRQTTVSSVLRHVRRGRILAVHSLRDGAAEIFEAEALETSPLVGEPLRDVRLPPGVIVGAIVRGDEVLVPAGDSVIRARDRVVLVARAAVVKRVEKMFAVRLDFF
jgi:trk system potassium uptake protein TrkA